MAPLPPFFNQTLEIMEAGTITYLEIKKLYGFIKDESSEAQYFFHTRNCITDFKLLKQGDRVIFDIEDSKIKIGKVCAVNVKFA